MPLVVLAIGSDALACTCLLSTLEGRYESSPNVFTALITGARFNAEGAIEADFAVTSIFKGEIPFDKLRTEKQGTSCDTSFTVGLEYLFFLGNNGRIGACSGHTRIVPGRETPWLDLLRAYRDGDTPDLSSLWGYREYDGRCWLKTEFQATTDDIVSELHLEYRYAEGVEFSPQFNRSNVSGALFAVFTLPTLNEPTGSKVTVTTNSREFVATWSEEALPGRGRGAFEIVGDSARNFARELPSTTQVEVDGSLETNRSLEGTVIRTTNAGDSISRFLQCLDNSQ